MNSAFFTPREFVVNPEAASRSYSLDDAFRYTRWLATSHYENFHVATFLLPRRLRQDFYNVYAFCRWADDLGDEIGDTRESLRLLKWWREELDAMYRGHPQHPVFMALQKTVDRHKLPKEPFTDLIKAFIQDQTVRRYRTFEELFSYCRCSANPVGRLVLSVCGYTDARRQALSDSTCTALQLVNFWQDVTIDWKKDRVYIPLNVLERHGSSIEDIQRRKPSESFKSAMKEAVQVARNLFMEGLPLARMVNRRLAVDLDLFSRGGLRVLEKIEQRDYDVLSERPAISKAQRMQLLVSSLCRVALWKTA